jgi:hypothetical protein
MKKLSDFFYHQANGYLVLAFLAAQFTFSGVILPYFQKQFDPELNRGLMDLSFGFSPEKGYNMLQSYGEKGREVYFLVESLIDVIYPITYTIAFILLLSYLFKKNNWKAGLLNLLPLGCLAFDLGENFGIVKMLKAFPERVDFWANLASNSGMVKWVFAATTILLVLVGLVSWGIKALRK